VCLAFDQLTKEVEKKMKSESLRHYPPQHINTIVALNGILPLLCVVLCCVVSLIYICLPL
jgi:hypothetical protein